MDTIRDTWDALKDLFALIFLGRGFPTPPPPKVKPIEETRNPAGDRCGYCNQTRENGCNCNAKDFPPLPSETQETKRPENTKQPGTSHKIARPEPTEPGVIWK